jgi:hypothetical protein
LSANKYYDYYRRLQAAMKYGLAGELWGSFTRKETFRRCGSILDSVSIQNLIGIWAFLSESDQILNANF